MQAQPLRGGLGVDSSQPKMSHPSPVMLHVKAVADVASSRRSRLQESPHQRSPVSLARWQCACRHSPPGESCGMVLSANTAPMAAGGG